jgi:hypothetical protein
MTVTATIHTPPPPPQPDTRVVTLQMPYDVAVTLVRVLSYVSGNPDDSYRGHVNEIKNALLIQNIPCKTGSRFTGTLTAKLFTEE